MPTVTYRPPDILHWFSTGSQEAIESAVRRGRAFTKSAAESSVKENIIKVAGVAADIGRGAAAEVKGKKGGAVVGRKHKLVVRTDAISFGGLLRRRTELVRDIERIDVDGDRMRIHILGEEALWLEVEPVTLTFKLESGTDEVDIGAEQLARRLTRTQASAV